MPRIDVSVVLTLHSERAYLARTLTSLVEAAEFAQVHGIAVELIAVLDRVDPLSRTILEGTDLSAFDARQFVEIDKGSPGAARNAGRERARGTYILHVDGDNLISYSMLARMLHAAQQLGPAAILVPKFSFGFGNHYHIVEYFSQDAIASIAVIDQQLYTVTVFYHRSLVARNRYADVPADGSYAYEGWHFNAGAMALGYVFHAVEHTALFYRQRTNSVSHLSSQNSTRPIPPLDLYRPSVFLRFFAREVYRLAQPEAHESPRTTGTGVLEDPVYRDLMAHANAIDPMIEISAYLVESVGWFSNDFSPENGLAYYRVCEVVGDNQFDIVYLLPGTLPEDTIDAVANAMHGLATTSPQARVLMLVDESLPTGHQADALPGSAVRVDLAHLCSGLRPDERDIVCLNLLQSCAANADLHCGPSRFAQRFLSRFGRLLTDNAITCHRRPDRRYRSHAAAFVDSAAFQFVAEHHALLDRIVVYDRHTLDADRRRLPSVHHKWHLADQAKSSAA